MQTFKKRGVKNRLLYIALYGLYKGKTGFNAASFYGLNNDITGNGGHKKDIFKITSDIPQKRQKNRPEEITGSGTLISPRKGEELLVDLPSLVDIGMQVYLRGLDGGMTEVFLYYPEIL